MKNRATRAALTAAIVVAGIGAMPLSAAASAVPARALATPVSSTSASTPPASSTSPSTTPASSTSAAASSVAAPPAAAAGPREAAVRGAEEFLTKHPDAVHLGDHDELVHRRTITAGNGLQYVSYGRNYRRIPVVGGDFVVVTDAGGTVLTTSVAQQQAIGELSVTPAVTASRAAHTARSRVQIAAGAAPAQVADASRLVVLANPTPTLAWESQVSGVTADGPSKLSVYVDATTGSVLRQRERVMNGTGESAYNGTVSLDTSTSGSGYSLQDPNRSGVSCQDAANNTTFSGDDDQWGNGDASNRETGCVDALFALQTEWKMLDEWLGRDGITGDGSGYPIRVGLQQQNAYYDGTQVQIGHNSAGEWIGSMDVVGHEFGHAIDDNTPGGISGGGTQEFVGDTFGAATEWFAGESDSNDAPDFTVGEEVDLVGSGPIRVMYDPSQAGNKNCYDESVPDGEVHAAAGPGNHWFYLLAQGSASTDGQPASPTCDGSTISGIGITKAITIMYNAMLMKNSASDYLSYRTWTLTAAKNLYPDSCTEFDTVKAAWDAVSVPAQPDDPTCDGGGDPGDPGDPGGCGDQPLANGGFEAGTDGWTASDGLINSDARAPSHSGDFKAWLDGYGRAHTDTLSQQVAIPGGCSASLSFYLWVDSAEGTSTPYDTLTVSAGGQPVASFSNADQGSGYVQRTVALPGASGTVTLAFTGTEDGALATSFLLDDVAVTLG